MHEAVPVLSLQWPSLSYRRRRRMTSQLMPNSDRAYRYSCDHEIPFTDVQLHDRMNILCYCFRLFNNAVKNETSRNSHVRDTQHVLSHEIRPHRTNGLLRTGWIAGDTQMIYLRICSAVVLHWKEQVSEMRRHACGTS